ncbi:RpoH suppressor [Polymorphobacter multimanifer]|uniref:Putative acylesterase/phospholipase RssA n=1 Tax=Polymorphobacter multimanifer TaxID=1070431 RepID=A0A841LDF5_9SPHN|nr:patatin-like phospholipase family protein [Polymorphobacter multimanifer]MBB6227008.1 putative acylesterase/phospholipase RssA [Polymorphobacter multimanifer]GGI78118.1 RpoH suppressor [Polymorphobacter multimanifer]
MKPAELPPCDVVLRGGITSGLVYPGALVVLAARWQFRNIGGASAGAIGAGLLAAAEYGRRSGTNAQAFAEVAGIPAELGARRQYWQPTRLQRLFQPSPALAPAMALVWTLLRARAKRRSAVLDLLASAWPGLVTAAGLAALAAVALGVQRAGDGWLWLAGLLVFGGALAAWLALLLSRWHFDLVRLGMGLCPGSMAGWDAATPLDTLRSEGAFADWMHAVIQSLAGRAADAPLTMRDLWRADRLEADGGYPEDASEWDAGRDIDLLLTTTNVSQRLPVSFPFLEASGTTLYFREDDLRRVLPAAVVAHLVAASDPRFALAKDGETFHRLPYPPDLPVVLGLRLSLSFPLLISAVRLWVTQGWRPGNAGSRANALAQLKPIWFSDGGITSNFPVSSFDALLPSRPTFCINLADMDERDQRLGKVPIVRMTRGNADGIMVPHGARVDRSLAGFLGAMVESARNGRENELAAMAGQRDRIVTILLDPTSQGGLNLDMDGDTIAALDKAGREAGAELNARFAPGGKAWRNHRWLRLRTSLAAIETAALQFGRNARKVDAGGASYALHELRYSLEDVPSYGFGKAHHDRALHWAKRLASGAMLLEAAREAPPGPTLFGGTRPQMSHSPTPDKGAPRPGATLVLQPNRGRDPRKG